MFSVIGFRVSSFTVISSANKDTLTSFFPICFHLFCLACLIAPVKTSNTILNKCGESGHPCFGLSGMFWVSLFTKPTVCLYVYHIQCLLCWDVFLLVCDSSGLLTWSDVGYCLKALFFFIWCSWVLLVNWHYLLQFTLICVLNHPCISGRSPTWPWWMIFVICSWVHFVS